MVGKLGDMTKQSDRPKDGLTRAEFLRLAAAAGVTLGLGRAHAAVPEATMTTRAIPKTDETLPVVGLSTYRSFSVGGGGEVRSSRREVLRSLFSHGGKVVDSSPLYGRAEEVLGALISDLDAEGQAFLSSKIAVEDPARAVQQAERTMRYLRTEHLDLMQVQDMLNWRGHMPTLRSWKENGRVRYLGVTHHSVDALDQIAEIIQSEEIDFVQLAYTISHPEAEDRVLPLAADKGVAVIIGRPFLGGADFDTLRGEPLPDWATEIDCTSWAQFFLKFILSHPAVTCVTPATSRPDQMLDNLGAGSGRMPDDALRKKMRDYWQSR